MQGSAELILKPGKERSLQRRHPWLYDTAIARVKGRPACGETVAVRGHDGKWLAWAAFSPASTIRARCWSFAEADRIDDLWLAGRISAAIARRSELAHDSDALRLVFGEADGLPGLIVDRYGAQLVVQFQAAGVDACRGPLLDAMAAATGCEDIFERSDSAGRKREGLTAGGGVVRGNEPPARIRIREHGRLSWVDVRAGHKTGYYIDQRDNRDLAETLAARARRQLGREISALNCFCYTGGFSVALARGGVTQTLSIDSSADALALAQENWALNDLAPTMAQWRTDDVFDALRALREEGRSFDLIVLDPPKFAASDHHVERAARAYKDINLNALRVLNPGGYLLTFSCSGAIGIDLFQKIVAGSVIDARVDALLLQLLAAGEDHSLLMTHPEGEYLKGLLLQRV